MRAAGVVADRLLPLTVALAAFFSPAFAQELVPLEPRPEPEPTPEPAAITPELQRELDELLMLTLPQQKQRARELIRENPDTELARTLERLLSEYATFDRIADEEQRLREARSEWGRAYWRSRCCPMPAWNPPVGTIVNETADPVLYEQRIEGIYHTHWTGPYRLRPGASHSSPHPFMVRFLSGGSVQVRIVVPGDVCVFRGSPDDGMLELAPGSPPAPVSGDGAIAVPPSPEPAPSEPSAEIDGPVMLR